MNDVRDILDLGGDLDVGDDTGRKGVGRKKGVCKPKNEPPKRPEGMHRELYALLCADGGKNFQELAPILPTDAPGGYKKKIKLGAKKTREWKWEAFAHPGRKDPPFLCHWKRVGDEKKEYPFAKFNSEVGIPQYSDSEYVNHLEQDGWNRAETDHLFDLCKRFDLRFNIVQDRWDRKTYIHRSVEDLKERYYGISNRLTKVRQEQGTPDPKMINYDAEHERKRKDQLRKLWGRTTEQVEEEEFLRSEIKKIEARKKEREKKTQDLQKLITAADAGTAQGGDGSVPGTPAAGGAALGKKMTTDPKKLAAIAAKKKSGKIPQLVRTREGSLSMNPPADVFLGIKWPDVKPGGVFVRSHKLKLPSSVGTKKLKAIEQIVTLLQTEPIQTPNEEITLQFNELRSDIVLLYELKSALTSCEMEIHSLAHQCEAASGIKMEIPSIFLSDNNSNMLKALETPTKSQVPGLIGISPGSLGATGTGTPPPATPTTPATPGSIAASLDVLDLDIALPNKKRKAALDQANILRKLKTKM